MPALRLFGRNWSLASDDIPLLAAPAALFHCLWCIFMIVGVGLLAHHYPTNCPAGGIPLLHFVCCADACITAVRRILKGPLVLMPVRPSSLACQALSICQLASGAGRQPVAAIPCLLVHHQLQPRPLCSLAVVALADPGLPVPCRNQVHGVPLWPGALLPSVHHPGGLADQGGPERWVQGLVQHLCRGLPPTPSLMIC